MEMLKNRECLEIKVDKLKVGPRLHARPFRFEEEKIGNFVYNYKQLSAHKEC